MRRRVLVGSLLLVAMPAVGEDDAIRLSLQVDAPPDGPFVQEMVRLTLRAVFRDQPNQVEISQPDFADARWMALGDDEWGRASFGGPARIVMQRRLAWFPQRSGTLSVGAFRLNAMVLDRSLSRVPMWRATAPVSVAVRSSPADAGDWWLPARGVRLTDTFSAPPGRLGLDQVARRTVVVEADGVEAPQVPPLPPLHVPGVIAFAQPMMSRTLLLASGPRVRVIYAWDIRPVNANPALLPEIRVPWFDTGARAMRYAVLPAVQVSLAEAAPAAAPLPPAPVRPLADVAGMVEAVSAAFLLGSAALWVPWPALWRRLRVAVAVARATRRGDVSALRAALVRIADMPEARSALHALDGHVYAPRPAPMPRAQAVLRALARGRGRVLELRP